MTILSERMRAAVASGLPIQLELGSGGPTSIPGMFALDHKELAGVDIVADLNLPLSDIPNECVDRIYSRHALEHVDNLVLLMEEIRRIATRNAIIEIIVPHFSNVFGYSDPTHVRLFGIYSMYYFVRSERQPKHRKVPEFYSEARFVVESLEIHFYESGLLDRIFAPIVSRLINRSLVAQEFYERRLAHFFHAWQIRYILRPD